MDNENLTLSGLPSARILSTVYAVFDMHAALDVIWGLGEIEMTFQKDASKHVCSMVSSLMVSENQSPGE